MIGKISRKVDRLYRDELTDKESLKIATSFTDWLSDLETSISKKVNETRWHESCVSASLINEDASELKSIKALIVQIFDDRIVDKSELETLQREVRRELSILFAFTQFEKEFRPESAKLVDPRVAQLLETEFALQLKKIIENYANNLNSNDALDELELLKKWITNVSAGLGTA